MKKKVLVAMSGGIDSSAVAYLLQREGYELVGMFMRNGIEQEKQNEKSCCSLDDAYDARRVADMLGIQFYSVNFKEGFETIIDYFVSEYNDGRTPNPCIMCNKLLKFGKLFEYADSLGIENVATGHYARIENENGRYSLKKSLDNSKDQSYVLFPLSQQQFSRTMLPLGTWKKEDVREIAREAGIRIYNKPDSQEICFVPDNNYRNLLAKKIPDQIKKGELRSADGKLLGMHEGYQLYTIGQRSGLGIATGKSMYVTEIDKETNTVIVGERESIMKKKMTVNSVNWISRSDFATGDSFKAQIKIRHGNRLQNGTVTVTGKTSCSVEFDEPINAITPGQAAVFYNGDTVIGGGWIV